MKKIVFKDISELENLMTDEQKQKAKEEFEKYYKNYCDIDIFYNDSVVDDTDYLQEVDLNLFD